MTVPIYSSGTSMVTSSIGSHFSPLISEYSTVGLEQVSSYPSRRILSIRTERCISPRPATRKLSVVSPSVTRRDTSRSSSRYRRSRRWREVTNLPSLPAKGESLTEKVISIVGSETLTNSSGSTAVGAQTVSPILMSSAPENATMSPIFASGTCTRFSPSNW